MKKHFTLILASIYIANGRQKKSKIQVLFKAFAWFSSTYFTSFFIFVTFQVSPQFSSLCNPEFCDWNVSDWSVKTKENLT